MQVSELYRRGVVLAKTQDALRELVENNVRPESEVTYIPISESAFATLWEMGFFHELNGACGTNIDDYEENFLPHERIALAEKTLRYDDESWRR